MVICLYGASSQNIHPDYLAGVEAFGSAMGRRGHALLFGGGDKGLMGAAARGVKGEKDYVMGLDVFCFYTQDAPTRNDMSVAKDFTLTPGGPEVLTHEDEGKMEKVDTLYWSSDRKVTCPAAGARLEIS